MSFIRDKIYKYKDLLIWLGLFLVVFAMAYVRPIHQDDGWYASYSMRIIDKLEIFNDLSYWSFETINESDLSVGFLFASLQVPFYLIFGISVIGARMFDTLVITLVLYIFYRIAKNIAQKYEWILLILLMVNQVFYYHFYNRPEILAAVLVLLSSYFLINSRASKKNTILAFMFWGLIIDVHPIAIFVVFGLGLWFLFQNKKMFPFIIIGGFLGIFLYFAGNLIVNQNFGLFNGILGFQKPGLGDHYIPFLESDINDYIKIFKNRFFNSAGLFVFLSCFWLLIPLIIRENKRLNRITKMMIFNFIVFMTLSTLFTEAASNGWSLYFLLVFLLMYIPIIKEFSLILPLNRKKWVYYLILPLLFLTMSITGRRILINTHKFEYGINNYSEANWEKNIPDGSKVLMRPTFVFSTAHKNLYVEYPLGILNIMKNNNISFFEAIVQEKYDYIVLDDNNLSNKFILEERLIWTSPYYKRFNGIGFSREYYNKLVSENKLIFCNSFKEPLHGKSVIYKVNKNN